MAAGLSREKIVAAALHLLDTVGFEALTTRLLARELGVQQPALYWHFKNKRDLADAMAAAMLSPQLWPGPHTPGMQPKEWLAARAHALRAALLAHRDGALIHAGTAPGPETYVELEDQVSALVAYGLSPAAALRTLLTVGRYTLGWVLEEQARSERTETDGEPLSKATEPTLKKAVAALHRTSAAANFDFGLRCILDGFLTEAQASADSKTDQHHAPRAKPSRRSAQPSPMKDRPPRS